MKILKTIILTLSIAIIGYLGFVFFLVFGPEISNYQNRKEFQQKKWIGWEETEETVSLRWDMVDDLTSSYNLIGMTTDEVIELLGEPDRKTDYEFAYNLGMARHGIDTGVLSISIENGIVKNYYVYHG